MIQCPIAPLVTVWMFSALGSLADFTIAIAQQNRMLLQNVWFKAPKH